MLTLYFVFYVYHIVRFIFQYAKTKSNKYIYIYHHYHHHHIVALHWVMFQPNIVSLCDEEQKARWLPLCRDWRMIGCYAQTELGHGSNIRALETTATFLPESKGGQKGEGSWVINSPTLTSGKFWPGTLGRTANVSIYLLFKLLSFVSFFFFSFF